MEVRVGPSHRRMKIFSKSSKEEYEEGSMAQLMRAVSGE
jgi:hypothetical protein